MLKGRDALTLRALLAATTALAVAPAAMAQTGPSRPQAQPAAQGVGLEEVVVTARRRTEDAQTVPVSVTAFSGEQLQERGVTRVSDLTQIAPGLGSLATPFGNGALTLTMRGQRQGLPNLAYDAAIPVYLNEVVISRSQGLNAGLFDLESVQVLAGPQGTLFGRNSTGGALLITTKAPGPEFGGYVRGTLGDYSLRQFEAAVNVPITDWLQARVSGIFTKRKGYTSSPTAGFALDDEDTQSWRLSLRFQPAEAFRNDLVLNHFMEDDGGTAFKPVYLRPGAPGLIASDYAELAAINARGFHTTNSFSPRNGQSFHTFTASDIATLDVGDVTFKNILGYRRVKTHLYFDLDGLARFNGLSIEDLQDEQFSEEAQVLGSLFDKAFDYVAGVFYLREKGHEWQYTEVAGAGLSNTITDNEVDHKSFAVYAQGTYHVPWVEGLSLTAGGRWTKDRRQLDTRNRFYSGQCRISSTEGTLTSINPCFRSVHATFKQPTWTVSADWKINPDTLLYVTARKGYQTGGFTNSANFPSQFAPFEPQTVVDVELGAKVDWTVGEMRGRTNLALFRGKYKDIQRLTSFQIPNPIDPIRLPPFTQNRIQNAASSVVKGWELQQQFRPVDSLLFTFNWAHLSARYKNYIILVPTRQDLSNAPFAGAPKNSYAGMVRWSLPNFSDMVEVAVQVDGSYQTKTVVSDSNSFDPVTQTVIPTSVLPGFGSANARLEFNNISGRGINFALWVRNFTDEENYVGGLDQYLTANGRSVRLLGAPRTYGADLRVEF